MRAFESDFMESNVANSTSSAVAESRALYHVAKRIKSFGKEWRDYLDIGIPLVSDFTSILGYDQHKRLGE